MSDEGRGPLFTLLIVFGGLIEGFGLAYSGMARPEVVLDFLQLEDFGLLLVMGGASVVAGADASVTPKHLKYLIQKSRERDVDRRVLTTTGAVPETVARAAAKYDVETLDSAAVADAVTGTGTEGPGEESAGAEDAVTDGPEPDGPGAEDAGSAAEPVADSAADAQTGTDPKSPPTSADSGDPPVDAGYDDSPAGADSGVPPDGAGYGGPSGDEGGPDEQSPTDGSQPSGDRPQQRPPNGPRQPPPNDPQQPQPRDGAGQQASDVQSGTRPPPPQQGQASGSLAPGQGGRPPEGGGPGGGNGHRSGGGPGRDPDGGHLTTRRTVLLGGLGLAALAGWQLDVLDSDDGSSMSNRDGFLESKSEASGQRSTRTVIPLEVANATGHELGGGAVGVVRVTVKRSPGSDDVDLSRATARWVGPSGTADLVHPSADGSGADGYFGTEPVRDADGSHPVLNDPDDRIALVFDLGSDQVDADDDPSGATGPGESSFAEQLPEGASVILRIETADGGEVQESLTVPGSLSDSDTVSL